MEWYCVTYSIACQILVRVWILEPEPLLELGHVTLEPVLLELDDSHVTLELDVLEPEPVLDDSHVTLEPVFVFPLKVSQSDHL